MSKPTQIEKESLEAHVELCAVRYNSLEQKLNNLETRMDKLELLILEIRNSVSKNTNDGNKQLIGIITSILGIILAGFIGFIGNGILK